MHLDYTYIYIYMYLYTPDIIHTYIYIHHGMISVPSISTVTSLARRNPQHVVASCWDKNAEAVVVSHSVVGELAK